MQLNSSTRLIEETGVIRADGGGNRCWKVDVKSVSSGGGRTSFRSCECVEDKLV